MLGSLDSLFLLSDFAIGFSSFGVGFSLGFSGFGSRLCFSFGLRLRSGLLALLRDTLLLLPLNRQDPGILRELCSLPRCRADSFLIGVAR